MCNSWALDLITLMGRPSLTVISVMLFPAAAVERSRLSSSSSSVHKRHTFGHGERLQANETGPGVSFTVTGVAHSSGPRSTDDIQRWIFKAEPQTFQYLHLHPSASSASRP